MSTPIPGNPTTQTITLDDAGRTITLHPGERFLLSLGLGYDWVVNVDNPSVVSRVVNILVVQGAQGVYEARQPGQTTLSAVGDPPCRKSRPPCMAPSRLFRITIVVQ